MNAADPAPPLGTVTVRERDWRLARNIINQARALYDEGGFPHQRIGCACGWCELGRQLDAALVQGL